MCALSRSLENNVAQSLMTHLSIYNEGDTIGKITNRELLTIRQTLRKGLTPKILEELVTKYGYDVIVSSIVSSTASSIVD